MTTKKVQKIAFQKLLKISKDRSFDVYETFGDIYGSRAWKVDCFKPLRELKGSETKKRQQALDETLMNLTRGDSVEMVKTMEAERKVIRLLLEAGANPNYHPYGKPSVFNAFMDNDKVYGALEVAKADNFTCPEKLNDSFSNLANRLKFYLYWKRPYPGNFWELDNKEKTALYAQSCSDEKELVCTLFQKGMYPQDREIFEKLSTIVLEKDPDFFNKKKQQVLTQMKRAKTPLQIYNVLTGKRREKN